MPCVAWEGVARVIGDYFRKGRMILAEGSIGTRSYEAKDGGKRYVTEVNIQKVEFCGDAEEPFGGEPEYEDTPF